MVFNATFNKISAISRQSVVLVEETGVPGENHRPVVSHWQTVSHNVVSSTPRLSWVSICTDLTGSCKSNYHTIMTTTAPRLFWDDIVQTNRHAVVPDLLIDQENNNWTIFNDYCYCFCTTIFFVFTFYDHNTLTIGTTRPFSLPCK